MTPQFPRFDYLLWFAITALQLTVTLCMRRSPSPSVRAVRTYLILRLVMFPLEYAASLMSQEDYFCYFFADCLIHQASLFVIVAAIHHDLRGKTTAFGSVKTWVGCSALAGITLGYALLIKPPADAYSNFAALLSADQSLTYAVSASLFGILLYGFWSASSWPKVPSLIWIGTSLYVAVDSFSWERVLEKYPTFLTGTHYIPSFVFFVTLWLWTRAGTIAHKQQETSQWATSRLSTSLVE